MRNGVHAAQPAGPGGNNGEGNQLSLSIQSREELTSNQVAILLHIVNTMRGIVLMDPREGDAPTRMDGETHIAANSAMVSACQRLEEITKDPKRWDLTQHSEVHKAILDVHKKQVEMLDENISLVRLHRRPSFRLQPTIVPYGREYFLAYWGDLHRGLAIIGRGATPEAALEDFDKAFARTLPEQLQVIAEARAAQTETPQDFRKDNQPPNEQ